MTAEELRAAGWPESDVAGILRGQERAEARIAEIMSAPDVPASSPSQEAWLGTPEHAARELADRFMKADAAAEHARAAATAADPAVVTERPGEADAPQRRAWALRQARLDRGPEAVLLPGTGPDKADCLVTMPDGRLVTGEDGQAVVCRMVPRVTVTAFGPDTADAFEELFERQRRASEDALLCAHYGAEACAAAGIVDADAAARLARPKPPGARYDVLASVARPSPAGDDDWAA